jgi:hypothetical protein
LLAEQLGQPASSDVSETDRVITTVTDAPTGAPPSLTVGAEAWRQAAQKRSTRKRTTRKRATSRRKSSKRTS